MSEFNYMLFTSPLYWTIIITCLLIIIAYKLYDEKLIGCFGEYWTKQLLSKLPKDK